MKILSKVLLAATLTTVASSCKSFLDINTNPNSATSVTPNQLLANALVVTAANYTNYNAYSSFAAGYWAKSNAISGFNEERTYGYSNTYQQGLWTGVYDNLQDYQLIRTSTVVSDYPNYAAIARIMQAYNFLLLVDEYGDIPYTTALQGVANTNPTFDKAADIYKDLIVQLKGAVTDINAAADAAKPTTEDVVFGGNMDKWKAFANSLRLRILLRESSTSDAALNAYVKTEMALLQAPDGGFITTDVTVQPRYAASNGQQNPFYNSYGFAVGSTNVTSNNRFILTTTYYVNLNLNNGDTRLSQEWKPVAGTTSTYKGSNLGEATLPSPTTGSTILVGGTFLRGATQPTVLMLLAEHLFSKSEAEQRGLLTGDAKADFMDGIRASYQTTYRGAAGTPATVAATPASDAYMAANVSNGLVNWDAATTAKTDQFGNLLTGADAGQRPVSPLEKIITQKWLAESTIASTEGWDDFRRLSLPAIPVSLQAQNAGQFPTRLLYPQVEINTNKANVPTGITQYINIFWDPK